ncbi:MAG: hypothetical protein KKH01_08640 [Firmicutes bacterium]|nr:hypothetical protein [Bacillota bacterium]
MKKFLGIIVGIFFLTMLVGCQSKTTATASFYDVDVQETTITLSVLVSDPDLEITGTVTIKLIRPDGTVANYKEITTEEDYVNIVFSSLDNTLQYSVEVHATIDRDSIIIGSATYTLPTADVVHITTPEQFLAMNLNRAGNYVLDNDIDFTDVIFSSPFSSAFSGTFDGQDFTISNVTFDHISTYTGLFGYVSSGTIQNLVIDQVSIGTEANPLVMATSSRVGILAGYISSSTAIVENVIIKNSEINYSSSSTVQAYVGGVVGEFRASMINVTLENVNINLTNTSYGKIKIGGAVGLLSADAKLNEIYSEADIHFIMVGNALKDRDVQVNIGGVVGDHNAITYLKAVQNVASMGDITVDLDFGTTADTTTGFYAVYVGGIAGFAMSNVTNGFYGGTITLNHEKNENETDVNKTFFVGGLFGFYGSSKANMQVVRYNVSKTIDINISDDVTLKASQTFGDKVGTTTHEVGVFGDESLNVNTVSELAGDSSVVYTDLTDYFSSDWGQTTFENHVIPVNE